MSGNSSRTTWWMLLSAFVCGVGVTRLATAMASASMVASSRKEDDADDDDDKEKRNNNDSPLQAFYQVSVHEQEIMDAPDLENRILRKAETVIRWRTSRIILIVERCTNDYNYSAIMRTAEALGLQHIWIIDPPPPEQDEEEEPTDAVDTRNTPVRRTAQEVQDRKMHHLYARQATEWLTITEFSTSEECVQAARDQGYQLWVTDLSQHAECLTMSSPAVPDRVALVMGTEAVGCSQYMLDSADKRVYLPLRGFADSLNLSVATALVLHQIFVLDPSVVGAMSETERRALREEWFPKLAAQRILTSSEKKHRQKLTSQIRKCKNILALKAKGHHLQPKDLEKLDRFVVYKAELARLEQKIDPERVREAVQEYIDHPPPPLTDMRRADDHRVTFVGKNTKKKQGDYWRDMPATANPQTPFGATASMFREKMGLSLSTPNESTTTSLATSSAGVSSEQT